MLKKLLLCLSAASGLLLPLAPLAPVAAQGRPADAPVMRRIIAPPELPPPDIPRPPPWQPPRVQLPPMQSLKPVAIAQVQLHTEVLGQQAQTRVELHLHNPNARVLEGHLQFPLLPGQQVTGFALDIEGQLRDAVPVPKARGQEIFEDIRRRQVDPGLLEAVAANQYQLRVYPIPANGQRRVVLHISESLPAQPATKGQSSLESLLRLPLAFGQGVQHLQASVRVAGRSPQQVRLIDPPTGATAQASGSDTLVQLPPSAGAADARWLQVAVAEAQGPSLITGLSNGQRYFAGQVASGADEAVPRRRPRHIALLWDASGSAATLQPRVLPVLDAYFRALAAQGSQPIDVSLITLRHQPEPARRFSINSGNWQALADALRATPYDGASNFDHLPVPADADTALLITDGLATDGQRQINYRHPAPLLAISAGAQADWPRLQQLAQRSGGALADAMHESPQQAVRPLLWHGWQLQRLDSLSATDLVSDGVLPQHGRIRIAGVLPTDQARITLHWRHPDGRTRTDEVPVHYQPPPPAPPSPAAAQAAEQAGSKAKPPKQPKQPPRTQAPQPSRWAAQQWAALRLAELGQQPQLHRTQMAQIAAAHGLPGPGSSLIVLEEAADYARYNLPAPPELQQQVARIRQQQQRQAHDAQQNHLETVVRDFAQKRRWWAQDFPKGKPPAPPKGKRQPHGGLGQAMPAAAPAPAPAPTMHMATTEASADASMATSADARAAPHAESRSPDTPAAPRVALQAWVANAPYAHRLRQASLADLPAIYYDERRAHASSSAFYLDAAAILAERGQHALALQVLSNLAELNLENRQLLRLYGYRLMQLKHAAHAAQVFERVRELAPNEPQSWRDLGLALAEAGQPQAAVDALWEVVSRPWNERFSGVNLIALAELNAIAATAPARGQGPVNLQAVDPRLRHNLPLGLRVALAWDTDDTDIDLHVTDPNDEQAFFGHALTYQGGLMSPDATGGYGPEEFALRQPKPGEYRIHARFYGERQQVLSGATTLMLRISTGFGTPQQQDQWLTLPLEKAKDMVRVGEVTIP